MSTHWLHYHANHNSLCNCRLPRYFQWMKMQNAFWCSWVLNMSQRSMWMHSRKIPQSMPNAVNITEQAPRDEVIREEQNLMFSMAWEQQIPRISHNVLIYNVQRQHKENANSVSLDWIWLLLRCTFLHQTSTQMWWGKVEFSTTMIPVPCMSLVEAKCTSQPCLPSLLQHVSWA